MLPFSLKRDRRLVAYQIGRTRVEVPYHIAHAHRSTCFARNSSPTIATHLLPVHFSFAFATDRLLEIRGPNVHGAPLWKVRENCARLRRHWMKDFTPAINAYRLLVSLTETSTSHPRHSTTHSPSTYRTHRPNSTDRSRKKERRRNFGRKQSRPTSSRFVTTFHVTQRRPVYESWDHPTRSRTFKRTGRRGEERTKIKRIGRNRERGVQGAREEGTRR